MANLTLQSRPLAHILGHAMGDTWTETREQRVTRISTGPDPKAFGLSSFAELLPGRVPIIGEIPGAFARFHGAMMADLAPATPYECVIAENLIALEWEMLQHRRMRSACISEVTRQSVRTAVFDQREAAHKAAVTESHAAHVEAGGSDADWRPPDGFNADAARIVGQNLAGRATAPDRKLQAKAYKAIKALGLNPVELMSQAYASVTVRKVWHERQLEDLERRRREVQRDFDALRTARLVADKVMDAREIAG